MRISDWSSDVCSSDLETLRVEDQIDAGIAKRSDRPHRFGVVRQYGGRGSDDSDTHIYQHIIRSHRALRHARDSRQAPVAYPTPRPYRAATTAHKHYSFCGIAGSCILPLAITTAGPGAVW